MRPTKASKRMRAGGVAAALAMIAAALTFSPPAVAEVVDPPWMDTSLSPDQRAELLLAEMTLEEKADLMAGQQPPIGDDLAFYNNGNARLGIPDLRMADIGPGVRMGTDETTAFPMGIAGAATWNPAGMGPVGQAVKEEMRLKRFNMTLGTNVDLVRIPWWSRIAESFGEDPLLSGLMGARFVESVQAERDMAVNLKHYNVYSQETLRTPINGDSVNMIVDERTLQEVYTRPWASAVGVDVASVMCAYNKVNGEQSCENNHLIDEILREQLGFEGFVLTDFGATRPRTEPMIEAGVNIETGYDVAYGPAGVLLVQGVNEGRIDEALIDVRVLQILRTYFEYGIFDKPLPETTSPVPIEEHGALAREVAEQAQTLLKNDGALPLNNQEIDSIAVVGQGADWAAQQCCAGAVTNPTYMVTPLEGITTAAGAGVTVQTARGVDAPFSPDLYQGPESIPSSVVSLPDGSGTQGVQAVYWDNPTFQEPNIAVRTELRPAFDNGIIAWFVVNPEVIQPPTGAQAVSYSGEITAPTSGEYRLSLSGFGSGTLTFDGEEIVSFADEIEPDVYISEPLQLEAGESYPFQLDYAATNPRDGLDLGTVRLGWVPPAGTLSPDIDEAVELARNSDVAVVVAGIYETEARDRAELDLSVMQDELIEAVADANPNTIVVLQSGGPVLMPWLDKVRGVVQTYYSGAEQGNVLGDILFGNVNPSGKLPITYPATETQVTDELGILNPLLNAEERDTVLTEGVNVGYRGYAAAGATPLFPFGHGLSYTSYEYENVAAEVVDGTVNVSFTLTNTGDRAGSEVAQVYAGALPTAVETPVQQLAGFGRIDLQPGESKTVTMALACKSLAYWDTDTSEWVSPAGDVNLGVGASAGDIRLQGSVTLPGGTCAEDSDLAMSASSELVLNAIENEKEPKIKGRTKVGDTLTVDEGRWSVDETAFEYQWLRDGQTIDGATGETYTLVAADAETQVSVVVTATAEGFAPGSAETKAVKVHKLPKAKGGKG
jgi:beta-glucosidase